MKIANYRQYQIAERLVNLIVNPPINESENEDSNILESRIFTILRKLQSDLKFNTSLILTFGVGVKVMYPIVEGLIKNGTLQIELSTENIVLISLAALTITYLEESKNSAGKSEVPCDCQKKTIDCEICGGVGIIKSTATRDDARTILEELKLRGIGNRIIEKMVQCFTFLGSILKILFKNSPYVITGLIDILIYTNLLVPVMNALSVIINQESFTMDSFLGNASAIALGITLFLAKYGFEWLVSRFKKAFGFDPKNTPATKPVDIVDKESENLGKNKLIKEQ
jgi:hypothetical protein